MNEYLNQVYWNNRVIDYLTVFGAIIIAWIFLQIVKRWVIASIKKLASRSTSDVDDVLISGLEKFVIPYIYLLINFAIINQLKLSVTVAKVIDVSISCITVFFGARFINHAIQFSLNRYMARRSEAVTRVAQMNGILKIFKVLVWAIGLLFLLDNLGYEVTTIITGLGIGGIAIALAAQNILSDLFSYFVIFFDKPFEIGDFVVAGDKSGTVEQIGIKTSRIRTLGGEELVMPNAELVKTPIHNFKRQQHRRVASTIRVTYTTPTSLLREIPDIVKRIVASKEDVSFDRAHLQSLADYYINYEIVYNISNADYTFYMNTHQAICLELIEAFQYRAIEFAIPTQAILLNNNKDADEEKNDHTEILIP